MPAKDFKFVSPGVFINEIDNSQLLQPPGDVGPAIIGRAQQGPGLIPTTVNSFQEFVKVFGAPVAGATNDDVFRNGNSVGPTYGAYAAQAWLKNNPSVTYVRLVGRQSKGAVNTAGEENSGFAGWATTQKTPGFGATQGGAYGLFVVQSGSAATANSGTLAAIWYVNSGSVALSGTSYMGPNPISATAENAINTAGLVAGGTTSTFTFTIPSDAGGEGTLTTIKLFAGNDTGLPAAADQIGIGFNSAADDEAVRDLIVKAINAETDGAITYADSGAGQSGYDSGMTAAADGGSVTEIDLTIDQAGDAGNLTDALVEGIGLGSLVANDDFTGGAGEDVAPGAPLKKLEESRTGTVATNQYFESTVGGQWKAVVKTEDSTVVVDTKFDFDMSSENFIRKVFNTNPILSNEKVTNNSSAAYVNYFLGETFEDEVNLVLNAGTGDQFAFVAPLLLDASTDVQGGNFLRDYADPKTGWFIAQDLTTNTGSYQAGAQQKLFRCVAKNTGRWASRNLKVSIQDIRAPSSDFNSYGTFTIAIRAMNDTDSRPKILEQFNNCSLNPRSPNYVARKVGNKFKVWREEERRYIDRGDYDSQSDYIYMEMSAQVHEGNTNPWSLPFGVWGPNTFVTFYDLNADSGQTDTLVTGGINYYNNDLGGYGAGEQRIVSRSVGFAYTYPKLRLRVSASEGNPTDPRNVWFGVDTTFNRAGRPSRTIGDYTGPKPAYYSDATMWGPDTTTGLTTSWIFTLDDIMNTDIASTSTALTGTNVYVSGSRQMNPSERDSNLTYVNSGSWREVLTNGADQFTTVLVGGFDGLNVKEAEPFRNTIWSTDITTPTEKNSYTFNSVKVAIDSLRDPEEVEFDLAAMPGITNNTLNRNLVDVCDDRADALAIIDLQGGYEAETESTKSLADRMGSVTDTINNKRQNLQINSSFGAAYYPWVQVQDTINGAIIWAPPSIAAIGAMSYGQATQELWFAPAGFTRGGLSVNNAAGIPVLGVRERLVSKDRDRLYEANINPIAQFPAEGIVIFGQKTLQVTPSALDRINVRRLLVYCKRQISKVAATLLFDQNVETTWNRFRGRVGPILADVQAGLGLSDWKLVLDRTTTTPDLIDRNIMYAQIFLKPARAIEFIAIDFVITDSGASFED